jgi:hypothetical protein
MSVKKNATGTPGPAPENVDPMRDGDRLRAVLERHGKKAVDLEKALGKTRQMVNVYLNTTKFTAHNRDTIRKGLDKMGIDPAELADDPTAITDPMELRRLLEQIPFEALPDVKRMLEIQDRSTKAAIIAMIIDRIESRRR